MGRHCRRRGRGWAAKAGAGGPSEARRVIALVGNPNTGKSVVFHYLTGRYVEVSNYPGTTVEVARGWCGPDLIVDTPGVYGISDLNDEEKVTRDAVLRCDLVVNVVDAAHLDRDLFLTLQLCDLGVPLVVCLNMVDEAKARGRFPDASVLEANLGVPVIPTVAVKGEGLAELRPSLDRAVPGHADDDLGKRARELLRVRPEGDTRPRRVPDPDEARSQHLAVLYLEGDRLAARELGLPPQGSREKVWAQRRERADHLADLARAGGSDARRARGMLEWGAVLDRLLTWPPTGVLALAMILGLAYWFLGVVVAQHVVALTEGRIMQGYWEPAVRRLVAQATPLNSIPGQLLAGEFGLLTMTVTYIVGLLLPLVGGFYLLMAWLEDTGYLPRVAVLLDRALTPLGLNGRAVIPLILGFGCVTMAIVSTRVLATGRERRLAIVLLSLAVPCSAQLGVVAGMVSPLGVRVLLTYAGVVFLVFTGVGLLLNRLLPGHSSALLLDLPPLRLPRLDNLLRKVAYRSASFLREAGPLFFYGAAALGVLQVTGLLSSAQGFMAPVVTGWLRLPAAAATALVMGFVRRDFGAAGLFHLGLSAPQILVAVVVITLFVPCVASVLMIAKERGWLEAAIIWVGNVLLAVTVGGLVARLAPLVVQS